MALEFLTERSGVVLREFTPSDSVPLFELIDCNRAHLSQHGDNTAKKYPDRESVLRSISNPPNPRKLRFGIWDGTTLVGTVNLTPIVPDGLGAIGYWVGTEHTGRGYASLAGHRLCVIAVEVLRYTALYAFVHKDNRASQHVLERCGLKLRGIHYHDESLLSFAFNYQTGE